MKKEFVSPELTLIRLEQTDVIVTSGETFEKAENLKVTTAEVPIVFD